MGAWGPGLYSSDFALDLRATIAAVSRLPFDGDRILELVRKTAPQAAHDAADSEYTTFWLVLADQFGRKGIACSEVTARALSVIDSGVDADMMRSLGMTEANIRKRVSGLEPLRARLSAEVSKTRRGTVKKPQRLLMALGDIYAYPISRGNCFNPYVGPDVKWRYDWSQDAWSALLVLDTGLAFEYLAWYTVATLKHEVREKPDMRRLSEYPWTLRGSGTMSPTHMQRMGLELVGTVALNRDALEAQFGTLPAGTYEAIHDVSIANRLWVVSKNPRGHVHVQASLERKPELLLHAFASVVSS